MQTLGTLGDVMPYIALGQVLQGRGHDVSIFAPRDFQSTITGVGLKAAEPTTFLIKEWMEEAEQRGTLAGPVGLARDWSRMIKPLVASVYEGSLAAACDADIVVSNPICQPARVAAENLRIPYVLTAQQPVLTPSRQIPFVMLMRKPHCKWINRASYLALFAALRMMDTAVKPFRRNGSPSLSNLTEHLGLPLTRIVGMSPVLLPNAPYDWDPNSHLTGYWSQPVAEKNQLTDEIMRFLDNGAPPLYISMGSMQLKTPDDAMATVVHEALQETGSRALLSGQSLGALPPSGDHTLPVGYVPHHQLFNKCQAVIHHGGAGTLDSAFNAGVPQIILPHMLDQYWHAKILYKHKLMAKPIKATKVKTRELVNMIVQSQSQDVKRRTARARDACKGVRGAEKAADIIESVALRV